MSSPRAVTDPDTAGGGKVHRPPRFPAYPSAGCGRPRTGWHSVRVQTLTETDRAAVGRTTVATDLEHLPTRRRRRDLPHDVVTGHLGAAAG